MIELGIIILAYLGAVLLCGPFVRNKTARKATEPEWLADVECFCSKECYSKHILHKGLVSKL